MIIQERGKGGLKDVGHIGNVMRNEDKMKLSERTRCN